jgi:hypothetical protein
MSKSSMLTASSSGAIADGWRSSVKVGDLVKANDLHACEDFRTNGIVVEHYPEEPGWQERVTVLWNDGDLEMELPMWLEVLSESR